jgi:hypothetical protein
VGGVLKSRRLAILESGVDRESRAAHAGSRVASSIAAAWVLSLGFDMFLHGGVLARLYVHPGPFVLAPDEAFRRIPLGYAAFLVLTASLSWLLRRLDVRGASAGFRHGAVAGGIVWGAFAAGLYSISTVTMPMLAGWWIGQTIELGLAGAVLGAAAGGKALRRIWLVVAGVVLACAAGTIVLQSLGLAPPMRVVTIRHGRVVQVAGSSAP